MKTYGEGKCFFAILTLDDLGMTQSQGQKCKSFSVKVFILNIILQ